MPKPNRCRPAQPDPVITPTTQLRPTTAKAPFAAGCGRATLLALSPPLLIANPTHPKPQRRSTPLRSVCATYTGRPSPTDAAPHSLTRHHPNHPAHDRAPANAVPSTALHLLTSTRPPKPQTNRSTAPANRSIRFTSLRFHSAQSVSAVQRKRTLIGAALSFAPFAQPTRQTSYRPTPAKAPIRRRLRKSNHAGSLSAFAHSQPAGRAGQPTQPACRQPSLTK